MKRLTLLLAVLIVMSYSLFAISVTVMVTEYGSIAGPNPWDQTVGYFPEAGVHIEMFGYNTNGQLVYEFEDYTDLGGIVSDNTVPSNVYRLEIYCNHTYLQTKVFQPLSYSRFVEFKYGGPNTEKPSWGFGG